MSDTSDFEYGTDSDESQESGASFGAGSATQDRHNGHHPTPRETAEKVMGWRIMPIPLTDRKEPKNPGRSAWQKERYTLRDLDAFNDALGVGLRLGDIRDTDGTVYTELFADADLDTMEAVRVAPFYLPPTGMMWGREGKPRSHYGYRLTSLEGAKSEDDMVDPLRAKVADGEKGTICELRFNGHTVGPGSINVQRGRPLERVRWEPDGDGPPALIEYAKLVWALEHVCSACLVAHYWTHGIRHQAALPLAGLLCHGGMSYDGAVQFIRAVCAGAREDAEATANRVGCVTDTYARASSGQEYTGGPTLEAFLDPKVITALRKHLHLTVRADRAESAEALPVGLPLHELVDKTVAALATAHAPTQGEPKLFVRGGVLVNVRADEHHRLAVKELGEAELKVTIDRAVPYFKLVRGVRIAVRPPKDVVQGVLGANVLALPALAGITEVPVLRPNGTLLLLTPGYDVDTHLLYRPEPDAAAIPPVPDTPTNEDVRVAFGLLHEVICDFPFHAPSDRANALGLLLTLPLRPTIRGHIPLALIDAPAPGTGKGLLTDTIALITIGHTAGTLTEVENDAAWRKTITSALMTGRPLHIVDNVEGVLNSPQLAALLTTYEWRDRLLATNREVCILGKDRGIWLVTGNNVQVGGDLPRRCYWVHLDAQVVNPFLRAPQEFKHHPLLDWVGTERHRIVWALLTICRAWFARGKPTAGAPTLGSFEHWAATLWGVLSLDPTPIGAMGHDSTPEGDAAACYGSAFLANGRDLWEEGDADAEEWAELLRILKLEYGKGSFAVTDVHKLVRGEYPMDHIKDALPAGLHALVNKDGFAQAFGHALRQHADKRYGNAQWRVEKAGSDAHTKMTRWRVTYDEGNETP